MASIRVCDRCGLPVKGAAESGFLVVEDVTKELCARCWQEYEVWMRRGRVVDQAEREAAFADLLQSTPND